MRLIQSRTIFLVQMITLWDSVDWKRDQSGSFPEEKGPRLVSIMKDRFLSQAQSRFV